MATACRQAESYAAHGGTAFDLWSTSWLTAGQHCISTPTVLAESQPPRSTCEYSITPADPGRFWRTTVACAGGGSVPDTSEVTRNRRGTVPRRGVPRGRPRPHPPGGRDHQTGILPALRQQGGSGGRRHPLARPVVAGQLPATPHAPGRTGCPPAVGRVRRVTRRSSGRGCVPRVLLHQRGGPVPEQVRPDPSGGAAGQGQHRGDGPGHGVGGGGGRPGGVRP